MMVLQQLGLFETYSRLRKLPSAFPFSHSFIPCSFSFWLLSHFFRKCLVAGVGGFTRSYIHPCFFILRFRLSASPFSKLHFHCYVTCKQHSGLCDMQIYFWTATSSPLPCYIFCTEMFRYIQFDSQGLTSPREPL
jgi:hypothetical protein